MELRKCVKEFAEAMELRFRENEHKGDYEEPAWIAARMVPEWLAARMVQEAGELLEVIACHPQFPWRVMEEAADVANFAMMIWDRIQDTTEK